MSRANEPARVARWVISVAYCAKKGSSRRPCTGLASDKPPGHKARGLWAHRERGADVVATGGGFDADIISFGYGTVGSIESVCCLAGAQARSDPTSACQNVCDVLGGSSAGNAWRDAGMGVSLPASRSSFFGPSL